MRGVGPLVSFAGHAILLSWGLVTFAPKPLDTQIVEALPIEFVTLSEVTDLTKGVNTAREVRDSEETVDAPVVENDPPVEEPQPIEEPVEEAQPIPEPQPEPQPEPEPVPETVELPQPEPEATSEPEPIPEPEPVEVARAPDASALEDLIEENLPDSEPPVEEAESQAPLVAPAPRLNPRPKIQAAKKPDLLDKKERKPATSQARETASLGTQTGRTGARMTQNELDSLVAQVRACWNPPAATVGNDNFIVTIQMQMRNDGSLNAQPVITGVNGLSGAARTAAEGAASRAVRRCAPYQLPVAKYDAWRIINVNFTPS